MAESERSKAFNWRSELLRTLDFRFIDERLRQGTLDRVYTESAQLFIACITSRFQIQGMSSDISYYLRPWERWEEEYARRGFNTLSLEEFFDSIQLPGMLERQLQQKRSTRQRPRYHAKLFRRDTLPKISEGCDVRSLLKSYFTSEQVEMALQGQDTDDFYRSDDIFLAETGRPKKSR